MTRTRTLALGRRHRHKSRGQSLSEFALIVPAFLTIFGMTLDFARLYQGWISLQAATRAAAEYVATSDKTLVDATVDARRIVCTETQGMPGFQPALLAPPADVEQCQQPTVTVLKFKLDLTKPGATVDNPIGEAKIEATLPFRMFFSYPFLTDNGTWTLVARAEYHVTQGR